MIWILVAVLLALVIYNFYLKQYFYWRNKNVAHKTPLPIPFAILKLLLNKVPFYDSIIEMYTDFPKARYNGIFQFTSPSLLIRDLDLVKRINVKDFDHFVDHRDVGDADVDPLFTKMLFQLNGQEWKNMRAMLSPAFTGSKMKAMFPLISDCAEQLTQFFLAKKENVVDVELKDLFTRYANDVIATCAFGVKCDSLRDPENTFFVMGQDATNLTGLRGLLFLLANFCPGFIKLFRINLFPKYISKFFIETIKETLEYRTKNGVIRPDMIHLLMEARKGKLQHEITEDSNDKGFAVVQESSIGKEKIKGHEITDLDIAAQAFIFFFAGFDTTSTMLCFMSTELAINTDIQDRLFSEIEEVMETCNGKPSYDAVMGIKYLDMVVSETLRKWPAGPLIDRKCTKEFTIPPINPEEQTVVIKVGETIAIPVIGLHRDEKYFPNPEKFDPERFSDENKHNIIPNSYIPFGVGPRACIASRFALLELKIMFIYLLSKFELVVIDKTVVPITLSPRGLKMQPHNGFWIGLKARV